MQLLDHESIVDTIVIRELRMQYTRLVHDCLHVCNSVQDRREIYKHKNPVMSATYRLDFTQLSS